MKIPSAPAWAFLLCLLVAGAASADPAPLVETDRAAPPDTVPDWDGFQARIYREGHVYIAGQPSEEALDGLEDRGVTCVVNLRTPGEMENRERVPFDEAEVLEELGIEYVWIPLGGDDHPYTPAAVEKFKAAVEKHREGVLLHCTVGWRASHLWAAFLVEHMGFAVDEAYARGEAIGIGETPFEKFLGRDLTLVED